MNEIKESVLLAPSQCPEGLLAVFLHTPFCGTCRMAERMLTVVQQMLPNVPIVSCDVNYAPRLVENWQVRSVPGLAVLLDGHLLQVRYAMGAVDELYGYLRSFTEEGSSPVVSMRQHMNKKERRT